MKKNVVIIVLSIKIVLCILLHFFRYKDRKYEMTYD